MATCSKHPEGILEKGGTMSTCIPSANHQVEEARRESPSWRLGYHKRIQSSSSQLGHWAESRGASQRGQEREVSQDLCQLLVSEQISNKVDVDSQSICSCNLQSPFKSGTFSPQWFQVSPKENSRD
ncbi:hypothetical protein CEXT_794761 [Caerostris extrusa]|uniref:Uncharacterized protein n=1 Tax=Caerostris extrusa TaxID=172846 RepID=A0AAV4NAF6_CAEEX|nr:hypothetical protein CEXT_794761 [Caerostris extrusa]